MQELIKNYYTNESNCYICPGKKECVATGIDSDGKKIYKQKRLLAFTVHDLYINFLQEFSNSIHKLPKFSYFASLKPVECIHAGDPGSHNICVCQQHENIKLKIAALSRKIKYRDVLHAGVCNIDKMECMLHRCNKCPGVFGIKKAIEEYNIITEKNELAYKNWITEGSRASLETVKEDTERFKNNLYDDLWDLTEHHFIADSQKHYLQSCKENLSFDTCIVIMDFSENYSFIIKDSVQAFYYNNNQATVHPFVVYFKESDSSKLEVKNFCVISDTKDHFAYTVHAFMEKFVLAIQEKLPWIKNFIYFSDGAPNQYKNK